jgi:glyoxylase-like metal-dependent hydrolase (beta-lactamase superfamily II)
MKLHTIDTGFFKLDGGAMFGVVPKSIWKNLNPPDENNMCNWAMRCMLVEDGDRLILIDNGIGNKQSDKFFGYYYLNGDATLENSLRSKGFDYGDITDVFLTHLHFDHCGGGVKWNRDRTSFEMTFPNAKYWTHETHWKHALDSNAREKASFLKDNLLPMEEAGHLNFVDDSLQLTPNFKIRVVNGHTESMMLPQLNYKDKTVVFCADLIPSVGHIPVNYVMAYDIEPLASMRERGDFLNEALKNDYVLYFEHDPVVECGTVLKTERGSFKLDQGFDLSQLG